jgi:hypothetical protein
MPFKELKEKEKQQPNHNVSANKRKPLKILKWFWGRSSIRGFSLFARGLGTSFIL